LDAEKKDRLMKTTTTLLTLIALLGTTAIMAQGKYGATPEDSTQCVRNLSLYIEPVKQGNYAEAYPHWQEVMRICPGVSKATYQNGAKMLRAFISKEKDPKRKEVLIDSLMRTYDMRMEYFGEQPLVLAIKGEDMLYYRPEACETYMPVLRQAVELNGVRSDATTLMAYYTGLNCLYGKGAATKEQMLAEYVVVSGHIEDNLARTDLKDADRQGYEKAREQVSLVFFKVAECGDIARIAGDMLGQRPDDMELKRRLLRVLTGKECTDEAMYRSLAEEVHKASPSSESAYSLGMYLLKRKEMSGATRYFKEAVDLCSGCPDKAKYLTTAGQAAAANGNLAQAKAYANQILQQDPKNGEALIMIGDAVSQSTSGCEEPEVWGVYWLAYDYYQRAKADPSAAEKAADRMSRAAAHFPPKDKAFFHQLQEGQSFQVTCGGLNESTTVRTRK
jgi:tetratricopeptide (TPR) repeat protein